MIAGRDGVLQAVEGALRRVRRGASDLPSLLVGQRGLGTTVLLDEVARRADGRWFVERVEPGESSLAPASRRVGLAMDAKLRIGDRAHDVLPDDLAALAAEYDAAVLLVVDDIHRVEPALADELTLLDPPVTAVAAGLPSSTTVGFAVHELQPLDTEAAADVLVRTAKEVKWSERAVRAAVDAADGIPYFLQEIGRAAWDAAGTDRISRGEVIRALPLVEARLDDGWFGPIVADCNAAELRYLDAMADLGPPPVRSGDIARYLEATAQALAPTRDSLIRRAICYAPRRGELDFTTPQFGGFLLRHHVRRRKRP